MPSSRPALWLMFFLIGFGLGYPTLNRYDPSQIEGTSDSAQYFRMVKDGPAAAEGHWRYRLLVPALARPIYKAAEGRIGTWNPVSLAVLVVNAAFCASSALMLIAIAGAFGFPLATGLIAAFAYLLNFEVANFQLAGMVDSAEAFLMMVLVLALWRRWWIALPVIGVLAALTKETSVPLALLFACGWTWREPRRPWIHLVTMAVAGLGVVLLIRASVDGHFVTPFQIISDEQNVRGIAGALAAAGHILTSWVVWLTFLWLVPFAWRGLDRLPNQIRSATVVAFAGALMLVVWNDSGANGARPLFDIAAPCLCLAFAVGVVDGSMQYSRP